MALYLSNKKCTNSDPVVITAACGGHSNTYDPSYVDPFVLARTDSSNYKKCADQCLKEVMDQMDIEPFVSIKAIRELSSKVIPERKYIDAYMINNIRICARKKKLELENADIVIDSRPFDDSSITVYRDTYDNYTEGKFPIVILFDYFL